MALLLATVAAAGCARAGEGELDSEAQYCRRAAALLESPVSDSAYREALPMLYSCPNEAGDLIAGLWEAPPGNDTTLDLLVRVGGHIHDGRIYTAARAVASDTARPGRERLAGLFTLVSHYNPYLSAQSRNHRAYPGAPANQVTIGYSSHLLMRRGAVPLPDNAGVAIAGLYARLARNDPNPEISYVAGELHRRISRYVAGEQRP